MLAGAFLLQAGCQAREPKEEGGIDGAVGRYVEEQLALPDKLTELLLFDQKTDGTLILLAMNQSGTWGIWESRDAGESWEEPNVSWLEELSNHGLRNAALGPDDRLYIEYMDPSLPFADDIAISDDEEEADPFYNIPHPIVVIDGDDTEVLPFHLVNGSDDIFRYASEQFLINEQGDYLIDYYRNIVVMDGITGDRKAEITDIDGPLYMGGFSARDNLLALPDGDDIVIYSIQDATEAMRIDGAPRVTLKPTAYYTWGVSHGHRVIALSKDSESVYFCDAGGLYRTILGSPFTECLMSGEQSSLHIPTMIPQKLIELDNYAFLVMGTNGAEGCVLYRYRFDETAPTIPAIQLTVFSMREDETIRQAMGVFQSKNPHVKVTYTVGMTGTDAISAEDVLQTLATELLADKGPDIIVLDNIPIDSYIQKGILADLNAVFDNGIDQGQYLDHVANTYRRDGVLYAIPARVSYPMLLGDDAAIASIGDIADLAGWLESQEDARLTSTAPHHLLKQFYPVYSPHLIDDNGVNEAELTIFLEAIGRLTKIDGIRNSSQSEENFDLLFDAGYWGTERIGLSISNLNRLYSAAAVQRALIVRGEGSFVPMPTGHEAIYIPRSILGINSASQLKDVANEFILCTLSQVVQANDFDTGLPVNLSALRQNALNPRPLEDAVVYLSIGEDSVFDVPWPEDSFFSAVIETISAVKQPSYHNLALEQILYAEGLEYLHGNSSLQDTVTSIKQKADILLSE